MLRPGLLAARRALHHIVYRSRGGKSESWNETGVCTPHHLHGIHRGYLTVRGRAGELLVWELGTGSGNATPLEVFVTKGGDNVKRVAPAATPVLV